MLRALALRFLVIAPLLLTTSRAQEPGSDNYQPERDYGHDWRLGTLFAINPEDGPLFGLGAILYKFGFRQHPYAYRMSLVGGVAFKTGALKVVYTSLYPSLAKNVLVDVYIHGSEVEVRNFFGFGNLSHRSRELDKSNFYRVASREVLFTTTLRYRPVQGIALFSATSARYFSVREKENRFLNSADLSALGNNRSVISAGAGVEIDLRDKPVATEDGIFVRMEAWHTVDPFRGMSPFQRIKGEARGYVTVGILRGTTLAVRAVAEKLEGRFPFFESAFIGGSGSLRGFNLQRYAGDAAAFGNAELRVALFRMKLIVPTEVGCLLLADAGRVWVEGASPGPWHTDTGGGFWLAPISRDVILSFTLASSVDGLFFNGGVGFWF
jgi:hypothetical protein